MSKEEMIEEIKKMTVVELADLVKAIEEEFGVSAVAAAAPAAGVAGGDAAAEKTSFNVVLKEAGDQKIKVIKVVQFKLYYFSFVPLTKNQEKYFDKKRHKKWNIFALSHLFHFNP